MSTDDDATGAASWRPLIAIFLAQVLMSFNVAALPVSIGGMVDDFDVPPTDVSTAIVMYGLFVAALIMVGSKLGQKFGWVRTFRVVVMTFALAELIMVLAPNVSWVIGGQALAGASAAIIVPSLVALIAENYHSRQQATAIGALGSARAISGVSAFFIGGALGTLVGWRPVFAILIGVAGIVLVLSRYLVADNGDREVSIDVVAALLIGAAIVALTLGFNNLNGWGLLAAGSGAPFDIAGVSPAPILVVAGVMLGQGFFLWTRRRKTRGEQPLVDLSVLGAATERSAVYAMFIIVGLEAAVNFSIPLYIQIVQGRSAFSTAIAMMPFNLTVFITATLIVRAYGRFTPRTIALWSFSLVTAALLWLSLVVTNNWETVPTILGLVAFGIGQGALVTLVFNVLVTAAPKTLAGDVGAVRGTTQNLASAVGTALIGALLVGVLSILVGRALIDNVDLPQSLVGQVDLDNINFVSNDQLRQTLAQTDASPEQIDAAVDLNITTRLDALRIGLLTLALLAAIAIIPASRLPGYHPGEVPDPNPRHRAAA